MDHYNDWTFTFIDIMETMFIYFRKMRFELIFRMHNEMVNGCFKLRSGYLSAV